MGGCEEDYDVTRPKGKRKKFPKLLFLGSKTFLKIARTQKHLFLVKIRNPRIYTKL